MAEVLGLVLGLVALVPQLTAGVKMLRQIRNADDRFPVEIDRLACDLELLVTFVEALEATPGALRLYPPAGTARWCPPGSNFHLKLADGSSLCVDGTILYNCHTLIQRDEAVYGPTVNDFVPERWLGNTNTSMSNDEEEDSNDAEKATIGKASESDIPVSAWRPFERGPRNCIGQELANIEARIILATVVVKYDFVKVGMAEAKLGQDGKPLLDDKGQHVSDTQLFSDRQITARPNDGIEVRVKLREGLRP
ncbi:Cytochrome monooxygenase apf8 like protein [Verticillium longisporum]|nr:Cytochrome monooxygenase apf8 like protein [Verticillium longisporum]